jgi:antitoxin HicB
LEEYLALPYRIILTPDVDDRGRSGFVAEAPELPGCMSQGATADDAVAGLRDAIGAWISVALEDGVAIPEPESEDRYSGKFVLRVPRSLHAELARAAERERVSLNQFAVGALAGAIRWRVYGETTAKPNSTSTDEAERTRIDESYDHLLRVGHGEVDLDLDAARRLHEARSDHLP